jgi:hypothetical protein
MQTTTTTTNNEFIKFFVKLFIDENGIHSNYSSGAMLFEAAQKHLQEKIKAYPQYRWILEPRQ